MHEKNTPVKTIRSLCEALSSRGVVVRPSTIQEVIKDGSNRNHVENLEQETRIGF